MKCSSIVLIFVLIYSLGFFSVDTFGTEFGEVLWDYETGDSVVSSPTVDSDGNIYFGSLDGFLYSLDEDGALRWKFDTTDWVESSPVLSRDESTVYVGSWSNRLVAVNTANGNLEWDFVTSSLVYASPAVAQDGSIYFGSSDGFFYALSEDGFESWSYEVGGEIDSSPAIDAAGVIYFGANEGKVCALDPEGVLLWSTDIPSEFGAGTREVGVTTSPLLTSDGDIIVGCENFFVYCFDAIDGSIKWRYETEAEIGGSCVEGMGRSCFVSGRDGYLYSFNWDGDLNWKVQVGENYTSTPCIDSLGRIYVGSVDSQNNASVSVFSADGQKRWQTEVGSFVDSSPVLAPNGKMYVGSNDGNLYAIEAGGGLAEIGWSCFGGGAEGWSSLQNYVDLSASPSVFGFSRLEGPLTASPAYMKADLKVKGGGPVGVSIRGLSAQLLGDQGNAPMIGLWEDGKQLASTENDVLLPWSDDTIKAWLEPGEYQLEISVDEAGDVDGFVSVEKQ